MKRISVFCGSRVGAHPGYARAARALGHGLARRGLGLVTGGGHVGLMGVVADAALGAGAEAIGVIPQALLDREVGHQGLSQLHVVDTMHERKALLAGLADGFVAMPGGIGTMEELFEVWTWAGLGYHDKPVALLNAEGYYDRLLAFLDHAAADGFVHPEHHARLLVGTTAEGVLDALAERLA